MDKLLALLESAAPLHSAGSGHDIHSESLALDGQGRPGAPVFGSVIGATHTMRELQIKLAPELKRAVVCCSLQGKASPALISASSSLGERMENRLSTPIHPLGLLPRALGPHLDAEAAGQLQGMLLVHRSQPVVAHRDILGAAAQ